MKQPVPTRKPRSSDSSTNDTKEMLVRYEAKQAPKEELEEWVVSLTVEIINLKQEVNTLWRELNH